MDCYSLYAFRQGISFPGGPFCSASRVIPANWTVGWLADQNPDGQHSRRLLTINNEFPPPALVCVGSWLTVRMYTRTTLSKLPTPMLSRLNKVLLCIFTASSRMGPITGTAYLW